MAPAKRHRRLGGNVNTDVKTQERLLKAVIVCFVVVAAAWSSDSPPAAADMIGHGGMVRAIDVSPDGRQVLTASFDYTARLWNFVEQTEIAVLDAHGGPVTNVVFLPDGKRAITTSDDMTAILWDLATSKPIRKFTGHGHKVMGVAVSKDGKLAATGSWDKTVRLWDIATGKQRLMINNDSPVNSVVFADGGKTIVAGDHKGKIHIWNASNGKIRGTLEGHQMGITQLAASPDGKRLLSASIDQSMRLWDLVKLTEIAEHGKHDGQIYATAFSPDGKTALSGGRYGYLIQWDLATGKPIRTIKAHDAIIWAAKFSPDGRFAITASSDEQVRVWHLESGDRIGIAGETDDEPKPWLTSEHPGAPLFKKCARCHSLSANGHKRSGPHLAGLFGRPAGSVKNYNYSKALTGVDFKWNEETLFQLFDLGPDKYLPGTKMPVQRVTNREELTQLVEYLKQITTPAR
jgi:cytochrome c